MKDVLKKDLTYINELIKKTGKTKEKLIPILNEIQSKYNFLPQYILEYIPEISDISLRDIYGVATFFSQYRLQPAGKHTIRVCVGTACHIKGALQVFEAFKEYFHIPGNEDTDFDKNYTVEKIACLGCCMIAPAVQIDDVIYGYVSPEKIPDIIDDFYHQSSQPSSTLKKDNKINSESTILEICSCSSCKASGSEKVMQAILKEKEKYDYSIILKNITCAGNSFTAPQLKITTPDRKVYQFDNVSDTEIPMLLSTKITLKSFTKKFLRSFNSLVNSIYSEENKNKLYKIKQQDLYGSLANDDFSALQKRIITERAGKSDALDLEAYKKDKGFEALKFVLKNNDPLAVINILRESGLRGRGGAGFSTFRKWDMVYQTKENLKYIICNGDEGDPGAFMDRMILESFPFNVIEGVIIAAYTLNIHKIFFFIRKEYPLAIQRLNNALEICRREGIIGQTVYSLDFPLEIEIFESAGAFVCGEETALISTIEGGRGIPRNRPPYPSESGLWGRPTLINNVETFAAIPWIVINGPDKFRALGIKDSKGTKTFALAGKVKNGGLIEVEMGRTLKDIIFKIGGGILSDKKLKAILIGGPSGGCIPADLLDTPVDYESLKDTGAIMGSGGLVVLDENDCMVDIARYFMEFCQDESCGKCTFCRIGTKRMLEILEALCDGKGKEKDITELEEIAFFTRTGSLCGLGKTAPNPVITALWYFQEEFILHTQGRCTAKKCKNLIRYHITDNCIGCTRCAQRCPSDAISGIAYDRHFIDQQLCVKCGTCFNSCKVDAVKVE